MAFGEADIFEVVVLAAGADAAMALALKEFEKGLANLFAGPSFARRRHISLEFWQSQTLHYGRRPNLAPMKRDGRGIAGWKPPSRTSRRYEKVGCDCGEW